MLAAVTASNDRSLTPMAAVAGAFGDCVADDMVDAGATKVIVNNGGDIALRLATGETARVGIAPRVGGSAYSHCIALSHKEKVGGVSTSGLGGRSLTLGVADAVTVMARLASLADACATSIANHTDVAHPVVVQEPATRVDPQTDIADYWVTTSVMSIV